MSFNSFKQFNENYSSLIKKLELEDSQLQKQYDKETDLSRNVLKQKEWNIRIAKELKELENYSSSIIKIPLKKVVRKNKETIKNKNRNYSSYGFFI